MPEPPPTELRRLLKRPGARKRLAPAVASLIAVWLVGVAAVGLLLMWHVVRRARLIRERLGPPRVVRLPEIDAAPAVPDEPRSPELQ